MSIMVLACGYINSNPNPDNPKISHPIDRRTLHLVGRSICIEMGADEVATTVFKMMTDDLVHEYTNAMKHEIHFHPTLQPNYMMSTGDILTYYCDDDKLGTDRKNRKNKMFACQVKEILS